VKRIAVVVPGSIAQRSGGYEYDRRIVAGLRARGWVVDVHEIDGAFPRPSAAALETAAQTLAAIPDGSLVLADGLAFGAMPAEAEREGGRLNFVALVHLPLAAHVGINRQEADRFAQGERRTLAAARACIVTGAATVRALEAYGVRPEQIAVVEPGTDRAPLARGSRNPLHLVSVAAITVGKGHEILLRALARLRQPTWRLTCAGSLDRDPVSAARIRELVDAEQLGKRVALAGELDSTELAALYDSADVFVHASLHETYGMVVAEALARGVPVVGSATGAIPDLVGSDAGVLVPPGDAAALESALSSVIDDADVRDRLAAGARRVRDRLPTWDDAVDKMVNLLARLEDDGSFAR
jgi:glycosyltransferase involved in cell wall biosynthesis